MNVLLVDDDVETLSLIARTLERDGHHAAAACSAASARAWLAAGDPFDVIVLDVMLPDVSGLSLCAQLREDGVRTPILFLSACGAVSARIDGLDAGADDYLPKPFALRELMARVRALSRRGVELRPRRVRIGAHVALDFARRHADRDGVEAPLTGREWDVLEALAARRGRAMAYDELLDAAWGEVTDATRASLEVIVARIRRKLDVAGSPSVVRTLRSMGYALAVDRDQ